MTMELISQDHFFSPVPGKDGASLSASLRIPADLPVFAGHFPGNPVLPGILLISAAVKFTGLFPCCRGEALALSSVRRAKFTAPVHPGSELTVKGEIREENGKSSCGGSPLPVSRDPRRRLFLRTDVEFFLGEQKIASMQLLFHRKNTE